MTLLVRDGGIGSTRSLARLQNPRGLNALEALMRSAGDEAYELTHQDSDMEKPRTCLQRKSDKCGHLRGNADEKPGCA